MPYPRLRWRLATLLEADEIDLWPELLAARGATVRPSEVVAIYPHRWSVPRDTWHRLFSEATREIAILAYSGLFIADDAGLVNVLAALSEAQRRARVREIWSAHLADLLDELMAMRPDGFERLASRLLREADFDSVNVTGKSGDGGIDGLGVYRLGLVSFPVFFQCKRYRGSVGPGAVRDFRGAMAGRGDKGLLITTGTFSADAKKEATRDGAPPIDLIDGDRLCDLLKRYDLGVSTTTRTVEDITIGTAFFKEI